MGDVKHYEDGGELSFFLRDDGTFAIVCNQGHAWLGEWKGVLKRVEVQGARGVQPDSITGTQPSLDSGEQEVAAAPAWLANMMRADQ